MGRIRVLPATNPGCHSLRGQGLCTGSLWEGGGPALGKGGLTSPGELERCHLSWEG